MKRFIKYLTKLQKYEKAQANNPRQKVIEEACEVIIAHLTQPNEVDAEKADLLMCLLEWADTNSKAIVEWHQRMDQRGRELTPAQRRYYQVRVSDTLGMVLYSPRRLSPKMPDQFKELVSQDESSTCDCWSCTTMRSQPGDGAFYSCEK